MDGNKVKTKLLKSVLKRTELMHAHYRSSSWTIKMNETEKKSSFVNKTKTNFRSQVIFSRAPQIRPSAKKVCMIE